MEAINNYLLKVLSKNDVTFFIPPYQRNYEWDEEQCEVFFNDILKVTQSNLTGKVAEHFFGAIVYVVDIVLFKTVKLILTDGQQRITTSMLFLAAIRDLIEDEQDKNTINNQYLINPNIQSEIENKIKLKQVEKDWEAYKNIVLNLDMTQEQIASTVYQNYLYFKKRLRNLKDKNIINNLMDLVTLGLEKFSIVTIQLQPEKNSWENPQEIFESMNSLGKPLSLADLVRNYLLLGKPAETQNNLYKNYWLPMEKQLGVEVSNFIRDFMQLTAKNSYKKASESNYKELYIQFKNLFKNYETNLLISEMKKYSTYYSYIVLGVSCQDKIIDKKLSDLRAINVTIAYSFLLDIIATWDNGELTSVEVVNILDALIVYFLRRRIIKLNKGENKTVPTYVRLHNELITSSNKKEKMFDILANQDYSLRLPNDDEIFESLTNMNFYNFKQAKFMFTLIEEYITKSRPDTNDPYLQIEHIMPQTLTKEWQIELGDDYENIHQQYINNIGNLTLIRHNQELGNKPFSEKKDIYKNNSGLQLVKTEITNKEKWNEESIKDRNKWISDFIVNKLISLPNSFKKKHNYRLKEKKVKTVKLSNSQICFKIIDLVENKLSLDELRMLTDAKSCKDKFKMCYPILKELSIYSKDEIMKIARDKNNKNRYYTVDNKIANRDGTYYLITNDWYDKHRPIIEDWINSFI